VVSTREFTFTGVVALHNTGTVKSAGCRGRSRSAFYTINKTSQLLHVAASLTGKFLLNVFKRSAGFCGYCGSLLVLIGSYELLNFGDKVLNIFQFARGVLTGTLTLKSRNLILNAENRVFRN